MKESNILATCVKGHLAQNFSLEKHINSKHEETKKEQVPKNKPFTCDKCEKSFMYEKSFNHHVSTIHESPRDLKCDRCARVFLSDVSLQKHFNTYHS